VSDLKPDTAAFYPPRYVTGALLKKMGWEFIRADQIKSRWKIIHKEKPCLKTY